jgi:hypothetical protein
MPEDKTPMVKYPFARLSIWGRGEVVVQNPQDRSKMNKWIPTVYLGLVGMGYAHEYFSVIGGIIGVATPKTPDKDGSTTGKIVDFFLAMSFEPVSWFQIVAGHISPPSDRTALSGPFAMAAWNLPGVFLPGTAPLGPKTGAAIAGLSANNGGTIWGDISNGKFKYYVGTFLSDPQGDPVYCGRLNLNLLHGEPGFFHRSSYFGTNGDILAIGVAGQYQPNGSSYLVPSSVPETTLRSDYRGLDFDVLFEKRFGDTGGVLDIEGSFNIYDGRYERFNRAWFGLVSYVIPFKLGLGKLQPLVRVQQANDTHIGAAPDEIVTVLDAQVGYLILGNAVRGAIAYTRHINGENAIGNAIWFGFEVLKPAPP